jgi:hypothetical protein
MNRTKKKAAKKIATKGISVTKMPFTEKEVRQLDKIVAAPPESRIAMKKAFREKNNRTSMDVNNYVGKRIYGHTKGTGTPKHPALRKKIQRGKYGLPTLPEGKSEIKVPIKSWRVENSMLIIELDN